jgi:tetraacyldisaccharide 4'-kinase
MIIARSIHDPICAKSINDEEIAPAELKGKKLFAFCGIGNPDAFFSTIRGLGANLIDSEAYNDHHHYTGADITGICEKARNSQADCILTTQKDWTKIASLTLPQMEIPFAYLTIELKLTADEDRLKQLIEDALAGKIS